MSVSSYNSYPDSSTDASFRAWGGGLSTALAAVGLVKNDTNINWATVSHPASAGTIAGYEIWRFNDALQATAPVYIKIEYACVGTTTTPAIRFSSGSGSNGSGTLTGNVSSLMYFNYNSTGTIPGTQFPCDVCGDTGRVQILLWSRAAPVGGTYPPNNALWFCCERGLDSSGIVIGDYYTIAGCGGYNAVNPQVRFYQAMPKDGVSSPGQWSTIPLLLFGTPGGSSAYNLWNGQCVPFPVFPILGQVRPFLTSIFFGNNGEFPTVGEVINLTVYGASLPYKNIDAPWCNALLSTAGGTGSWTNTRALIRWD